MFLKSLINIFLRCLTHQTWVTLESLNIITVIVILLLLILFIWSLLHDHIIFISEDLSYNSLLILISPLSYHFVIIVSWWIDLNTLNFSLQVISSHQLRLLPLLICWYRTWIHWLISIGLLVIVSIIITVWFIGIHYLLIT